MRRFHGGAAHGKGCAMIALVICLLIATPILCLAMHDLQAMLERWDYRRHADD